MIESENNTTPRDIGGLDLAPPPATAGQNHLPAIAIDDYEHPFALSNCVRDADAIVAQLTQQYHFDPQRVSLSYNGAATRKKILAALR